MIAAPFLSKVEANHHLLSSDFDNTKYGSDSGFGELNL
jgi:hypothetical protein